MGVNATLVPVSEYLSTSYKPACEYRDGVLTQKPMPTKKHARLQYLICRMIEDRFTAFEASPELTVKLNADRFLVPDVAVELRADSQSPYPTEPIPLCIEILSPDDRFGDVLAKAEESHAWGVPVVWILDPERGTAWQSTLGGHLDRVAADGALTAGEIRLPAGEVFA